VSAYILEQQIRYDYSEPVNNLCQRLMVVPRLRHRGQHRRTWALGVDGPVPFRSRSWTDAFGNDAITVLAPRVPGWVEFSVSTEVEVDEEGAHWEAPDPRYLLFTTLTAPDDGVAALAQNGDTDPAAICGRVHAALTYEHGITGVGTTAAEALAGGGGVCQDYAHVMVSVCRLLQIPARYVSGHLLGEGGSHAWVETLRPDTGGSGWTAEGWDPTHDRPTGAGYVTVAVGRDYADVAPMSGTYDGVGVSGTLTVTKRATAA
jgi:transglutaminase-like putative cysteine protease